MALVDVGVSLEHVLVIRSNIGPESVKECRDVQNESIWANFRKKAKGIPFRPVYLNTAIFSWDWK
jgi:hypothetical protein